MKKYIDRDALVEYAHCQYGILTPNDIMEFPTADVQPVKHGKWVVSATQKHVEVTYECSECQHEVVGEYEKTPFCGGCGIRMDGDNE